MAVRLIQSSGKLTFLRVHDVGSGFGPSSDFIDVEVVIKLDTEPDRSMGFELRNDENRPSRQGMLDLLRDAFIHDFTVTIDYNIDLQTSPPQRNGVLTRVWLTK